MGLMLGLLGDEDQQRNHYDPTPNAEEAAEQARD